ncbi:MAG: hypothetical protein IJF98_08540 [Firmicutes bacterium]|nr:hypothetical protein [Bacillota bacterium]
MKNKIYFLFLLIPLFLTGCWDLAEIENRNYVINLGIDNENDEYIVTYGLAWNDDETHLGSVKTASGENLSFLIENADISSEKSTFLGHAKTLILGENVLKDKDMLQEVISTLKNNKDLSSKVLIMECHGKASDAVNAISEEKQMYIWNFYRTNANNMGHIQKTTFDNIKAQMETGGTAIIPFIKVENDEIIFYGCGIISDGILQKNFNQRESEFIYILNGCGKGSLFEEEDYLFKVSENKRKIKNENGILKIILNMKGKVIYNKNEVSPEEIESKLETEISDFMKKEVFVLPNGDYLDIGKYLIKDGGRNINNIRYADYNIIPVVHIQFENV